VSGSQLGLEKRGTAWGLAALGAGAAGTALAIRVSEGFDTGASDEPMRAEAEYQQTREAEQAAADQARTAP